MQHHPTQSGFTLVEMLVSLALFTIVITMSVGSLLVVVDANAAARNMQVVMTNLAFALDSMTRDIRTGTDYACDATAAESSYSGSTENNNRSDCQNGSDEFSFTEAGNSLTGDTSGDNRIGFSLGTGADAGRIMRNLGSGGDQVPITSSEIEITELWFFVTGARGRYYSPVDSDQEQPTVTIFVKGQAGDTVATRAEFAMQTTVVQRDIDF